MCDPRANERPKKIAWEGDIPETHRLSLRLLDQLGPEGRVGENWNSSYIGLYLKITLGIDFGLWEVPKIDEDDGDDDDNDDNDDQDVFSSS